VPDQCPAEDTRSAGEADVPLYREIQERMLADLSRHEEALTVWQRPWR
jgi:antirestriction protein ArdC